MAQRYTLAASPPPEPPDAPTEDDLPYEDGVPLETQVHVWLGDLLLEVLTPFFAGRDVYIGKNMFVYYSPDQLRTVDYRGPDAFIALDVQQRFRKSWVTWWEGKAPDVVFEFLSDSTAHLDRGLKKEIYRDRLRVPEYYWFDPATGELRGFHLSDRAYLPIEPDEQGRLYSRALDLYVLTWHGPYRGLIHTWLRFATPDGVLIPTADERIAQNRADADAALEAERRQLEQARQEAEAARLRADAAEAELAALRARLAALERGDPNPPA